MNIRITSALPAAGMLILAACNREDRAVTAPSREQSTLQSFSCDVTYTANITGYDSDLAEYGVPDHNETVQVCQTWTGSDYIMSTQQVSTNDPVANDEGAERTIEYANGQIAAYNAAGGLVGAPDDVGATAFEAVDASNEERQASYDFPHYGVLGGGGGGGCANCWLRADTGQVRLPVTRPGVRKLIAGMEENRTLVEGYRRFRGRRGDADVTIDLEPGTELIARETRVSPDGRDVAIHGWRLIRGMHVRERLLVESEFTGAMGKPVKSRTEVTISGISWDPRRVRPNF